MKANDDTQRAAARCDRCGEIGIVRIRPNDRLEPIGNAAICDCPEPAVRVLEHDDKRRSNEP